MPNPQRSYGCQFDVGSELPHWVENSWIQSELSPISKCLNKGSSPKATVKIFTSKLQWSLKIQWSRAPFLFERELLIKFSPKSQNFQTTIFQMPWVVQRQPELKTPAQSATHHTVQIALKKFLQSHAPRTVRYRTRSICQSERISKHLSRKNLKQLCLERGSTRIFISEVRYTHFSQLISENFPCKSAQFTFWLRCVG